MISDWDGRLPAGMVLVILTGSRSCRSRGVHFSQVYDTGRGRAVFLDAVRRQVVFGIYDDLEVNQK